MKPLTLRRFLMWALLAAAVGGALGLVAIMRENAALREMLKDFP